ncbi:hypothetical protein PI124_g16024 [Phytophthora idaei]|nr:hypothetical protein PI125_g16157 [Phytophthora idaei]KAG3142358.1 hypothetical protein PI126_g15083 [Phytophthora idaei]KAG3239026.1 hypothetical protein PI124_g16024 [Phytophthora idaei]
MPASSEFCAFFFKDGSNFIYTCKICNGGRKQAPSTGYSNLLSHLGTKHPDYLTEMATALRAKNGSIESFGFIPEAVDHLYSWMRWVVVRNLPLCEVDDPLTRPMSRLRPTTSKAVKLSMHLVAKTIGKVMEEAFGVLFYDCTHGSTHFLALFAVYMFGGKLQCRQLSISPLDDGSHMANVHIDHFKRVLDLYNKTLRMVLFVVGDNCSTNRAIATKLDVPLIGCASHRLSLAVQSSLKSYETELDQVNTLMVQLRQPNNSAELAKFTDLLPVKRNAARWSSTREMLERCIRIRSDIRKVEAVEDYAPSASAHRKLAALDPDLQVFDSVCNVVLEIPGEL